MAWCSAGVGCVGVRFVAAWRLGSGVDKVGVWIAKVVLVINLVVRSEKKKWPRANAIGIGSVEGKKKRPGVAFGELQEEGQPAADSQHWTLPLAVRPGERFQPREPPASRPSVGSRLLSQCEGELVCHEVAVSGREAEWESGKIAGVGVREKSKVTVQSCQAQKRTWGATLLWALLPLCPRHTRRHRQIHEFTVPNVHGCVAIAWFRRASCGQARWEVGDDICVVLILPPSPGRPHHAQAGAPR